MTAVPAPPPRRPSAMRDGWVLTHRILLRWAYRPTPVILGLLFR